jgi:inorganic pyrophosphatase
VVARFEGVPNLSALPTFAAADIFHLVVESPRGSDVKLKYDSTLEAMAISRPLALGLRFPYDWGFIPSTRGDDGDPVDAIALWDATSFPGVVIRCRAVGIIRVEQNRKPDSSERVRNDRILAVPVSGRREAGVSTLQSIAQRVREEIGHFVIAATALEGKHASILGWDESKDALESIREHGTD